MKERKCVCGENQNNKVACTEKDYSTQKAENSDENQMVTVSIKAQGDAPPRPLQQVDTESQLAWLKMCILIYQRLMSSNACIKPLSSLELDLVLIKQTSDNLPSI